MRWASRWGEKEIHNSLDQTLSLHFPDRRPLVDIQIITVLCHHLIQKYEYKHSLLQLSIIKWVIVMTTFMVMTILYRHTNLLKLGQNVKALCLVILYAIYLWGEGRIWLSKTGKSISTHFRNLTTCFLWLNITRKQDFARQGWIFSYWKRRLSIISVFRPWLFLVCLLGGGTKSWFEDKMVCLWNILQCKWRKMCNCWNFYRCKTDERYREQKKGSKVICAVIQ